VADQKIIAVTEVVMADLDPGLLTVEQLLAKYNDTIPR
jgi:hypothetical protein